MNERYSYKVRLYFDTHTHTHVRLLNLDIAAI